MMQSKTQESRETERKEAAHAALMPSAITYDRNLRIHFNVVLY